MRNKRGYSFRLGTVSAGSNGEVMMSGWIDDEHDKDRPLRQTADTAWLRGYAERLLAACDATDKHTAERLAWVAAQREEEGK